MQEICLLIQDTVLRAASLYFHRGLRKCFANDYARSFDSSSLELIMVCPFIHLPTFQPPIDGAKSLALSPAKVFIVEIKRIVCSSTPFRFI